MGVNFEPVGIRLFNTNPFAVAFKRSAPEGFVVLAATDRLLRITLDARRRPSTRPPTRATRQHHPDPAERSKRNLPDPEDVIGGKPRGLVLNLTRAPM